MSKSKTLLLVTACNSPCSTRFAADSQSIREITHHSFPLKIKVNGSETHPIFAFLKLRLKGAFGDFIKW